MRRSDANEHGSTERIGGTTVLEIGDDWPTDISGKW